MFGHAASNPAGSASAAPRVSAAVDVAGVAGPAADDTSSVDPRRQQALSGAPLPLPSHQPPPPPSASSADLTTRDDRRRSLPSDLTRPGRGGASTTVAAADRSRDHHVHGRPTTTGGDDPLSAYRASARRHLNATTSSSVAHNRRHQQQHRPSRSSSAAPPSNGTAHPVIVRTYSGTPPPEHRHRHRYRVAAIREEVAGEMAPQPNLPPVEAFSFDDILKNVESEVGGALDAIAGICASCRYSPANHYDVHMPPHVHVEHEDNGNLTTTTINGQPALYTSLDAALAPSTIDPRGPGRGQHHVDLIESEYHTLNHPHASSAAISYETHSPMAFIETTSSRPTSLTSLPAPEILTELRRTDDQERTGNTPRPSMDDYIHPRGSMDGRREDRSIGYDPAGSARHSRRSSVLEQFAAWFPWGHDHESTADARRVDGVHEYPSAERQLRGLLAGRGAS